MAEVFPSGVTLDEQKDSVASQLVPEVRRKAQPRYRYKGGYWLLLFLGSLTSLLTTELSLHWLAGKFRDNGFVTQRWYREGIAESHFQPEDVRLTGNPLLPGAPNLVIVGDSHVEALQVPDKETMGSVLERQLRAAGKQWNVVQFAWSGADGPDYVYEAPLILNRYHPQQVIFVLNGGDFGSSSSPYAKLVQQETSVTAVPTSPASVPGRPNPFAGGFYRKLKPVIIEFEKSGLLSSAVMRFTLDILPNLRGAAAPENPASSPAIQDTMKKNVALVVRGLKGVFGDRLTILYTPQQMYSDDQTLDPEEVALKASCNSMQVKFLDLRGPMTADLVQHHELARGFMNTEPGSGHLNRHGHGLAAEMMFTSVLENREN